LRELHQNRSTLYLDAVLGGKSAFSHFQGSTAKYDKKSTDFYLSYHFSKADRRSNWRITPRLLGLRAGFVCNA